MVSGFICGTSKLPKEEDDYVRQTRSADSSPRRPRSKSHSKNNPYSTRGLDKFSSLLAKIEQKRKQIYSQVNPSEISFVRFEYFGDHDDFKPIVVKAKHTDNNVDHNTSLKEIKSFNSDDEKPTSKIIKKLESSKSMNNKDEVIKVDNDVISKKVKNTSCRRKLGVKRWRESVLVLPIIVVLILVFLVLFGRSFAIMCTSIGWYVIPTITNKNSNSCSSPNKSKTSFKRKDYAIWRLSNKKLMTSSEGTKLFKN